MREAVQTLNIHGEPVRCVYDRPTRTLTLSDNSTMLVSETMWWIFVKELREYAAKTNGHFQLEYLA